jgi:hypothetical protein
MQESKECEGVQIKFKSNLDLPNDLTFAGAERVGGSVFLRKRSVKKFLGILFKKKESWAEFWEEIGPYLMWEKIDLGASFTELNNSIDKFTITIDNLNDVMGEFIASAGCPEYLIEK